MSLVLGLEITPHAVRGAFLKTALRGSEMERYTEVEIPQSAEEQPEGVALRAAVAQVIASSSRAPDRVVAALDGDAVSLRLVDFH